MHHRATHLRSEAGSNGNGGGCGGLSMGSSGGVGGSSMLAPDPPLGSGGNGHYRYTPLATSSNGGDAEGSSSNGGGLGGHYHYRPPPGASTWEKLHWALVKHRWPLLGALALLVLALLLLGPMLQQTLSSLPPWKQTFTSLTGICKEEEEFQQLGRALWVAGDAIPKRFGCDPSQCHCVFLLQPAGPEDDAAADTAAAKAQKQQRAGRAFRNTLAEQEEEWDGQIGGRGGRTLIGEEAGAAGFSSSHHVHKKKQQQHQSQPLSSQPGAPHATARRDTDMGSGVGGATASSSFSTPSSYIRGLVLPGGLRRVNFFQHDQPLCLIPGVRYEDLVEEYRLDAARTRRLSKGPSLFYTSDIENPFHIMHFRARPIFDFMVRRGLEAGQAHFFEPKPKKKMPGGYGVFLMSLLGEQLWKDDFPEGSSVLFEDLWVRPRGKWLFPVHSYYPEVHDPRTSQGPVMYGPHIDPKWNQLARFVRRQVLGQGEEEGRREDNDDQPYILLVDRVKSRRLLDARTGSFEEVLRVLREEGGLKNLEAVRFEDIPEEEQFRKVMKARILVGVHGAALTNMAFQPPFDSAVVEIIFSPRKPDYPNMARTLGRGYHYVWAERAEEKYDTNAIAFRRIYVDSRKLLAAVKEAMAQRRGGVAGSLCC